VADVAAAAAAIAQAIKASGVIVQVEADDFVRIVTATRRRSSSRPRAASSRSTCSI